MIFALSSGFRSAAIEASESPHGAPIIFAECISWNKEVWYQRLFNNLPR
eukprot:UN05267